MQGVIPQLPRKAKTALCKRSLFEYEHALNPEFFKADRWHLRKIADTLQAMYEGRLINRATGKPYRKLMLNMPPRVGKSFSLTKFCEWVMGRDPTKRVMTITYNNILSNRFSKSVRDSIEFSPVPPRPGEDLPFSFQEIFPGKRIKLGDGSSFLWSLEGQYFNYLGTSLKGTMTGMGCDIGIVDDPIKDAADAHNPNQLAFIYEVVYQGTLLSRLEEGALQIVNMTRWHEDDLCGCLLRDQPGQWYEIKFESWTEEQGMLCEEIRSKETYDDKKKSAMGDLAKAVFRANYHQEPISLIGRLYGKFQTYDKLPEKGVVKSYTDHADTGEDYLCSIIFLEYESKAYILDIIYTQKRMEESRKMFVHLHTLYGVSVALIESNAGGRGFALMVGEKLAEIKGNTIVKWFHQGANKISRILTWTPKVEENTYYPVGWDDRWPEFYGAMTKYQKKGKNIHDDAPDTATGVQEIVNDDDNHRKAEAVRSNDIVVM